MINESKVLLVVDDHKDIRDLIALVIKNLCGHERILFAENGKEALEKISHNTIDLVITDYMMPVMDGYELIVELKKRDSPYRNIPIIAVTAYDTPGNLAKLLSAGADSVVPKPFSTTRLSEEIFRVLGTNNR